MSKPRALLVSDVPGWAFDQNMHDLADHLADDFEFSHFYTQNWFQLIERPKWKEYDVIYECFHRNPPMGIPYSRTVGALRSEWFKPEKKGPPEADDIALVNRYRAFQVAVKRNYDELIDRCPNVVYLTNPVNMRRFSAQTPEHAIIASWNGNAGHQSNGVLIKHFHDIVVPACKRAGVPLVAAEYNTSSGPMRRRAPIEMPAFYQQASVALCASEYEAASNSVMEAMASGLALIATDVGNHREMRDEQLKVFGDTGIILVERNVEAFSRALSALTPARAREMGEINRREIQERWSWDAWRDRYRDFLLKAIDAPIPSKVHFRGELLVRAPETSSPPAPPLEKPVNGSPAFDYWNQRQSEDFLEDDWGNPSRFWAGTKISEAAKSGLVSMIEVGPGSGIDYARLFRPLVAAGKITYAGYDGSASFCASLTKRFAESKWHCAPLLALPAAAADVVYTKAVLEHQPALEPSLSHLLAAARKVVILIWYRPPADGEVGEVVDGVHYRTYRRSDVLDVVARRGWKIVEEVSFAGGNVGWKMERVDASS